MPAGFGQYSEGRVRRHQEGRQRERGRGARLRPRQPNGGYRARYKVPRDVLFLDELPRNPTGKVLKRELAEL
jgi:acyl-CoA synthetase (AMP-forming)/AMP-acid ligase II